MDVRTSKIKAEEQFKYEVRERGRGTLRLESASFIERFFSIVSVSFIGGSTVICYSRQISTIDTILHEMMYMSSFQVNELSWCKDGDQFYITNGNGCVIILR